MLTPNTDIGLRVEAAHKRLRRLGAELTTFVDDDMDSLEFFPWKLTALSHLRDFQNQLAKHFDLEEEGGFIDDLLRLAPESSNSINHLKVAHSRMLSDLSDIIRMVKSYSLPSDVHLPRLRERVKAFLAGLREHESVETALLYEAHFQVNGAGD